MSATDRANLAEALSIVGVVVGVLAILLVFGLSRLIRFAIR